ncbi:MAG: hypothetical protein ACWGQW_13905 [bacterium]
MRQILFIVVLSAILMPAAAYQQNLIPHDSLAYAVFSETTTYCQMAENWFWDKVIPQPQTRSATSNLVQESNDEENNYGVQTALSEIGWPRYFFAQ